MGSRDPGSPLGAGASTRELMARLGHDSMRAALIYQHATSELDKEIAEAVSHGVVQQAGTEAESQDDAGEAHGA